MPTTLESKKYTKADFIEDVKKEAKALRKHATKDELAHLTTAALDPTDYNKCVYGLMTGDCRSVRASELIFSCCKRYFDTEDEWEVDASLEQIKRVVNGKTIVGVNDYKEFDEERTNFNGIRYYSSIEMYILRKDAKKKNLIAYLKGETNDLNL